MSRQRLIAWVNTETTGLEPGFHEIIEIAVVRTTQKLEEVDRWSSKIRPQHIERASTEALRVNGYSEEAWRDAPQPESVMKRVSKLVAGTMLGGHNVQFDIDFMLNAWRRHDIAAPWLDPRKVDTVGMCSPLLFRGLVPNLRLTTLTSFLRVEHDNAHTAMSDVLASLNAARAITKMMNVEA